LPIPKSEKRFSCVPAPIVRPGSTRKRTEEENEGEETLVATSTPEVILIAIEQEEQYEVYY